MDKGNTDTGEWQEFSYNTEQPKIINGIKLLNTQKKQLEKPIFKGSENKKKLKPKQVLYPEKISIRKKFQSKPKIFTTKHQKVSISQIENWKFLKGSGTLFFLTAFGRWQKGNIEY